MPCCSFNVLILDAFINIIKGWKRMTDTNVAMSIRRIAIHIKQKENLKDFVVVMQKSLNSNF